MHIQSNSEGLSAVRTVTTFSRESRGTRMTQGKVGPGQNVLEDFKSGPAGARAATEAGV